MAANQASCDAAGAECHWDEDQQTCSGGEQDVEVDGVSVPAADAPAVTYSSRGLPEEDNAHAAAAHTNSYTSGTVHHASTVHHTEEPVPTVMPGTAQECEVEAE